MNSQSEILTLIDKPKKNFTDLKQIILLIRKQSLKMSDSVIEFGKQLVQKYKHKLGDEQYIILEEIFYAGLEIGTEQTIRLSSKCLNTLKAKFPSSDKVDRMEALFNEAYKNDDISTRILTQKIQTNLIDSESKKRYISTFRRDGDTQQFIEKMNDYLYHNSSDGEAWMELADVYLENMSYNKALFCYEELLILFPKKFFYMMKIAEIYYTLGGIQNLITAKQYYSFILNKDSTCYRGLWGLIQTCRKIQQIKSDPKTQELLELCLEALKGHYKNKNSAHIIKNIDWKNYLKN